MSRHIACPKCKASFGLTTQQPGYRIICPRCRQQIVIPDDPSPLPPPTPPPIRAARPSQAKRANSVWPYYAIASGLIAVVIVVAIVVAGRKETFSDRVKTFDHNPYATCNGTTAKAWGEILLAGDDERKRPESSGGFEPVGSAYDRIAVAVMNPPRSFVAAESLGSLGGRALLSSRRHAWQGRRTRCVPLLAFPTAR
jgi:hypothetical protein